MILPEKAYDEECICVKSAPGGRFIVVNVCRCMTYVDMCIVENEFVIWKVVLYVFCGFYGY